MRQRTRRPNERFAGSGRVRVCTKITLSTVMPHNMRAESARMQQRSRNVSSSNKLHMRMCARLRAVRVRERERFAPQEQYRCATHGLARPCCV